MPEPPDAFAANYHGYTQKNRRAWNEIAQVRSRAFPPASFFAQGGSTLGEREVQAVRTAFGTVAGLRLIHLQCATGEDTLSWAGLGAQAYGVDIAEEQIAIAVQKAAEAGLPARFTAADIYDLPAALPAGGLQDGFDVVFTGGGAIVWLPDLMQWAQVVARLLRPGGRLVLIDEHPLAGCLLLEDGQLKLVDDYFRAGQPMEVSGWYHFQGGEDARETKFEFNWPLGEIVTAAAQASLIVERLEEIPGGSAWRFGEEQGAVFHLPGRYLLVARKA